MEQGDDRAEVFISYSHKDDRFRQVLEIHLSLLQRQGVISIWHDRKIGAGTEWKDHIDAHLDSAQLILLLVSPDFLGSDYCYDIELKRALDRHDGDTARVIPVIVRPVDWHDAPFAKLQALPKDGKAISTWPNRDKAYTDVVAGIRRAVRELREIKSARAATSAPEVTKLDETLTSAKTGQPEPRSLRTDYTERVVDNRPIPDIHAAPSGRDKVTMLHSGGGMFGPSPAEQTIRKAALAVAVSYMEKRDDDGAAKSALRKAIPTWSQDRVDGFLKRQKELLKRPASEFRRSIDRVVSEERQQGGV